MKKRQSKRSAPQQARAAQPSEPLVEQLDAIGTGRDDRIAQLTSRIQSLEAQLSTAQATGRRLQTALTAEQLARLEREDAKIAAYRALIQGITAAVDEVVPPDATVLVVSKGDDRLLELNGRQAWHFPQAPNGVYVGHHPANSDSAIEYLDALRIKGAQYLVMPATSAWWLTHYQGFKDHLDTHHKRLWQQDETGIIFALSAAVPSHRAAGGDAGSPYGELESVIESFQQRLHRRPVILDWGSGLGLADHFGQHTVFSPPADAPTLPYLDATIDVVCVASTGPVQEARRVASGVTLVINHDVPDVNGNSQRARPRFGIEWVTTVASSPSDASIIIPCYNGATLTEICLTALTASLPADFKGEIIVVDDGSTDDTQTLLKGWKKRDPRIQVLRRRTNAGFVDACNRGAEAATRKYLVFLNNDTEPGRGWLTALLDTFRRFPGAGAVGGKLVLPDGSLQEAGSVIFQNGSAANFMRGERDLESPLINYVREVDYCSAALLATPRRLFDKLGGFDVRYRPAYYEDVDYCFKVRQSGRRVYYQPGSMVMHREGGSCGTDITRGVKQHQVRNQRTFEERWKDVLRSQPVRPPDGEQMAWPRLAEWRRVEAQQR